MAYAAAELRKLGYSYVPGPSGSPSDLVLRQVSDPEKGFEWKGQEDYDNVGEAVVAAVQSYLIPLCGLEVLPLPREGQAEAFSSIYATPGFEASEAPLLLLICGSAPGGAAGVWGRALCINTTLHEGAMFDYIFRAKALGWNVLVANPNTNIIPTSGTPITGSECPHVHLLNVWRAYVEPCKAFPVLVVAHSYGGPNVVHLLKSEPSASDRIQAIAVTDGGAFEGSLLQEEVPGLESKAKPELRELMEQFRSLAPLAFEPAGEAVVKRLGEVARNFVSSTLPAGTPVAASHEGMPALSAGHDKHPSTTHAATEHVFAFLQEGSEGRAAASNDELRAKWESNAATQHATRL